MYNKEVEVLDIWFEQEANMDDKPLLLQKFLYFLLFTNLTPEYLGVD